MISFKQIKKTMETIVPINNAPTKAPEPEPIALGAITMVFEIDVRVNLDVLAEYIELNDQIKGAKFKNITRGKIKKPKKATSGRDFKNQCTLIVNDGVKDVNVKLFDNGRMVFTGITDPGPEQTAKVIDIVLDSIHRLDGYIEYEVTQNFKHYSSKDIFKKEIVRYRELILGLALALDIDINYEPFNPALSIQEAYEIFELTATDDNKFIDFQEKKTLLGLLKVIDILKIYYTKEDMDSWGANIPEYALHIAKQWNTDDDVISDIFPSYLENQTLLKADYSRIKIANINSRTNCNFALNREKMVKIMYNEPQVDDIEFDEDRYAGVIVRYFPNVDIDINLPRKKNQVTIIFFNSGKINILSSKTLNQLNQAYQFITRFCRQNFNEILMVTDYINRVKSTLDDLPNQYHIGEFEGTQYLLLKRSHIIKNPRNVLLLKRMGILDQFIHGSTN